MQFKIFNGPKSSRPGSRSDGRFEGDASRIEAPNDPEAIFAAMVERDWNIEAEQVFVAVNQDGDIAYVFRAETVPTCRQVR